MEKSQPQIDIILADSNIDEHTISTKEEIKEEEIKDNSVINLNLKIDTTRSS